MKPLNRSINIIFAAKLCTNRVIYTNRVTLEQYSTNSALSYVQLTVPSPGPRGLPAALHVVVGQGSDTIPSPLQPAMVDCPVPNHPANNGPALQPPARRIHRVRSVYVHTLLFQFSDVEWRHLAPRCSFKI